MAMTVLILNKNNVMVCVVGAWTYGRRVGGHNHLYCDERHVDVHKCATVERVIDDKM